MYKLENIWSSQVADLNVLLVSNLILAQNHFLAWGDLYALGCGVGLVAFVNSLSQFGSFNFDH